MLTRVHCAVDLQHATESSVHFRPNTRMENKRGKITAGYVVGKFRELTFYNRFLVIKVPSLVSTRALHLIILHGTASTLAKYKYRMLHRISHLAMHPRAAKRVPLHCLVSFSSSCLREASD